MSNVPLSKPFLRDHIKKALLDYFQTLEGIEFSNLYDLVLTEIEIPLLETVMHHTEGNQSRAAQWLGITRATLRKLLKKYNLV